ncbi:MAG: PKD domain-containing protein, partial [Acidobacteria bacterium]|nr:PKD domain-containing protein [Acidobacteriota bacterium]
DPNATPANPNTSTLKDPTHDYAEGTYTIRLGATSSDGCTDDTTVQARFALRPVLVFTPLTAVCQEAAPLSVAKASVTNGVNGTGIYKGPGTSANGNFDPRAAGYGNHAIWYVFTTAGGCSDSISQPIRVHATPLAAFSVPAGGCLDPGGRVDFLNGSSVPDGQSLSYQWNFGDPNATGANPNTSTLRDPSHTYGEGTFNIRLGVTSQQGCVKDSSVTMTFGLKPVLAFAALDPVCEDAAPLSIARGSVTNGVTGTGVYRGPGTSSNGGFDPAAAGHGTHTIWYLFTTAGGCRDSVSRTITVHPRPTALFTATAEACINLPVTVTDASTIPSGSIVSWQWDLGDGTTPTRTGSAAFTHVYATAGTYKVRLVAVSALGCKSL